ncbi:MAG: cysteine desulfurase [Planctomycetes bacterium]|nr:cysteine desulfurase [Planctomycetota bacterium]
MTQSPTRIYLDNNATTKPFPEVVDVMSRHFRDAFGNPGSRHAEGRAARRVLEDARESMAEILDADPKEIIFTSSGTESSNLAIFGLANGKPGTIALTAGEHPATVESCQHLRKQGWKLRDLTVDRDGLLIPEQYADLPWNDLKLVTVILAHNETGVIQDMRPLSDMCRKQGVPLHLDAVQAVGKIPVRFHELGATSLALGAHKFHGPRGIGALLLKEGVMLSPYLFGGHQEAGRRPGTEPVALIAGMAKALEIWHADRTQRMQRIRDLRDRLQNGLSERCAPAPLNGSLEKRLPNTLNISFPGVEGEALLIALDLDGIACSLGSTCASGSAEPAPALAAMGCPVELARSAVRFSVSCDNTVEEIDAAIQRIGDVCERLRKL